MKEKGKCHKQKGNKDREKEEEEETRGDKKRKRILYKYCNLKNNCKKYRHKLVNEEDKVTKSIYNLDRGTDEEEDEEEEEDKRTDGEAVPIILSRLIPPSGAMTSLTWETMPTSFTLLLKSWWAFGRSFWEGRIVSQGAPAVVGSGSGSPSLTKQPSTLQESGKLPLKKCVSTSSPVTLPGSPSLKRAHSHPATCSTPSAPSLRIEGRSSLRAVSHPSAMLTGDHGLMMFRGWP